MLFAYRDLSHGVNAHRTLNPELRFATPPEQTLTVMGEQPVAQQQHLQQQVLELVHCTSSNVLTRGATRSIVKFCTMIKKTLFAQSRFSWILPG